VFSLRLFCGGAGPPMLGCDTKATVPSADGTVGGVIRVTVPGDKDLHRGRIHVWSVNRRGSDSRMDWSSTRNGGIVGVWIPWVSALPVRTVPSDFRSPALQVGNCASTGRGSLSLSRTEPITGTGVVEIATFIATDYRGLQTSISGTREWSPPERVGATNETEAP
jgi:hypothetical protein